MKFENICRTCLSESSDLRSVFKLGVIAGKTTTVSKVLMDFTKLTISESDCLPDKICYGCFVQVGHLYAFYQTCLESERFLKEEISKIKNCLIENECNDENIITESETQTVYLYSDINIEEHTEINVHLEPSDTKDESLLQCSREQIICNTEILASEELNDLNQNDSEAIIQDIMEEENLETEILEENEDLTSRSSYENINNQEYYENNKGSTKFSESMEDIRYEIIDENVDMVEVIKVEEEKITKHEKMFKRKRKIRSYSGRFIVPGPPYICNICSKNLSTKSSFKYHLQLHSDSTPFLCNECGEGFKTRNAYEGHMTTHDVNNPNKCKICGKIYRQGNSLKTHLLTHTGEKPFLCGICGKGMTQKSGLKKHMLVHSGEMPYECKACHKRFRYSSNLIAHKKTHSEKKKGLCACLLCNKLCNSPSEMKKHMDLHELSSEEEPSQCLFCGKYFLKLDNLEEHINMEHKHEYNTEEYNNTSLKDQMLIE